MARKVDKKIPIFTTDADAIDFMETADLSEYDLSGGIPSAEFFRRVDEMRKTRAISLRLPQYVLDGLKAKADAAGVKYQTLIRALLEKAVGEGMGPKKAVHRAKKAA